ncbi:MAG TPA: hypothetical protein VES67_01390 [Vicinamibacterales bacterium]|nr:hypothetical protein [Vicinamibacterales bacterium]
MLKQARTLADEAGLATTVYATIPTIDFSREVAAVRPDLLAVVDLPMAGWTDLGEPSRVLNVMADRRRPGGQLHLAAS